MRTRRGKSVLIGLISAIIIPLTVVFGGAESAAYLGALCLGEFPVDVRDYRGGLFEVDETEFISHGLKETVRVKTDEAAESEAVAVTEIAENSTALSSDPGPQPYPEKMDENGGAIAAMSYTKSLGTQFITLTGGGQVRNSTSNINASLIKESSKMPDFTLKNDPNLPQVLIMHTHTTESFEPYSRDFNVASFTSRTSDERKNIVAVGEAIAQQLRAEGIGVIHDKTVHDYPSYNGSYERSAVTVKKNLEQYPSVKIVLDVHRDAIERDDGTRIAPVTEIGGRNAAQIMLISGCDDGSMNMPNYLKNFRFACLIQQQMESDYAGLTRPILFAYRKYNQDLTTGSVLVEVGGHANSLDEAIYSGELAGKSIAKALKKLYETQ